MVKSRIAFIVVCMKPGETGQDGHAVVVGTMPEWTQTLADGSKHLWPEGSDWRYATHSLSSLSALLDSDQDPLSDLHAGGPDMFDLLAALKKSKGALTKQDIEGLAINGLDSAFLGAKVPVDVAGHAPDGKRALTALVVRNIERAFFFTFDNAQATQKPFAALDTARLVHPDAIASNAFPFDVSEPDKPGTVGSRLILFPDLSTSAVRPRALAGLSMHLQIKVAANGHSIDDAAAFDSSDTRMLLDLALSGGGWPAAGKPKTLWCSANPLMRERGMQFDIMQLRCTLAAYRKEDPDWARSKPAVIRGNDLLEFAYANKLVKVDPAAYDEDPPGLHVPLLAAMNDQATGLTNGTVTRTCGFRALAAPWIEAENRLRIESIGWRFELANEANPHNSVFFEHPQVRPVIGIDTAGLAHFKKAAFTLVQEQHVSDIARHLGSRRSARTLISARIDSADKASAIRLTVAALASLNGAAKQVHTGLKMVHDGSPLSMLPTIEGVSAGVSWELIGSLTDDSPGVRALHDASGAQPYRVAWSIFEPSLRKLAWDLKRTAPPAATVLLRFPRMLTETRSTLRLKFDLLASPQASAGAADSAASVAWPACQSAVSAAAPGQVATGARIMLRPVFTEKISVDGAPAYVIVQALRFLFSGLPNAGAGVAQASHILYRPATSDPAAGADQIALSIDATIMLPLASVEPAAEDDLAGASRARAAHDAPGQETLLPDPDAPLLLGLTRLNGRPKVDLNLRAVEVVRGARNHSLALSLRAIEQASPVAGPGPAPDTGSQDRQRARLLIIEPSPFRVAAVDYDVISGGATSENNEVAVWNESGEGGLSWQVRDERQVVDLILQPQAVGEAMEKNRAELADLPPDIAPGKPSAARFGSHTILKVDPTYADTVFREPSWNLRRILGSAMQRNPGVRLLDLRLELLYGLLTRVRADDLWTTEIAGAIGAPPAPLPDSLSREGPLKRYVARTAAVLAAQHRRLAVEKLWRGRPDRDLQLTEGVSFKLRRIEAGTAGGPVTPLRWPIAGDLPANTGGLIDPAVLAATFSSSPSDAESFPGGPAWAFESANILMRVYSSPQADGGSVRGLHLTALGGFGAQRSLFDARRTIIESETGLARVQRFRLERIGRISSLWHRAKHVIVFERTVVPGAQGYNRPPIGRRQDEHLGRALPRKVEEYVEIMTPVRHYPEDGTSVREAGFMVGAEFKSVKIRVDSAWGSDVRREGWKVPLWNTAFLGLSDAGANPDAPGALYPRPQICLRLAGADGKDNPFEVADPEKLHFYTSVLDSEDDNTDLWQPVRDVDFCDLPAVRHADVPVESADLRDAILPPAPSLVPGYELFTLSLIASGEQVAITRGRLPSGPMATLHKVTIGRAGAKPRTAEFPVQHLGAELAAKAANVRAELERRVGRVLGELDKMDPATAQADLAARATALISQASAGLGLADLEHAIAHTRDQIGSGLKIPVNSVCAGLLAKVEAQVGGQLNRLLIISGELIKQTGFDLHGVINQAAGVAGPEIARARLLAGAAQQQIPRLKAQFDLPAARLAAIEEADAAIADIEQQWADLQAGARAQIWARFAPARARLSGLDQDLDAALRDWRARNRANLNAVLRLVDNGMIDTANQGAATLQAAADAAIKAAKQFHAQLAAATVTEALSTSAKECAGLIDEQRARLRAEMAKVDKGAAPPAARRLIQGVDLGMAALVTVMSKVRALATGAPVGQLVALSQQAQDKLAALQAALDAKSTQIAPAITELSAMLDTMLDKAQNAIAVAPDCLVAPLRAGSAAVRQALAEAEASLDMQLGHLAPVQGAIDALKAKLAAARAAPASELTRALFEAADQLQRATDQGALAVAAITGAIGAALEPLRQALTRDVDRLLGQLKDSSLALLGEVHTAMAGLNAVISVNCAALDGFANGLLDAAGGFAADKLNELIGDALDIANYEAKLKKELGNAIAGGAQSLNELKANLAQAAAGFAASAEHGARQLLGSIQESVRDMAGGVDLEGVAQRAAGVYQQGDNVLRALSAFGNPPKASNGMDFNRADVQFVMGAADALGVDMTPTLALCNRARDQVAAAQNAGKAVGELLDSFGLRIPVSKIGEQLIPESLKGLALPDCMPAIAALEKLFKQVGFPELDDMKAVKVKQGMDTVSKRLFMEANLDIPFDKPTALMSFGPVEIIIDRARITASSRISTGAGGAKTSMNGEVAGDWRVVSAGQTILTFRQTKLYFDESGKIDFKIQPERIELADALKFITDLMGATGQKGGLRIEPFVRGGIPSGVAATLDMVLPPIQTGAFGISDLSLHVMFGLAALPSFEIVTELSIGIRTAPFTLNVWILNGGGYLMQRLSYLPAARPNALMTYTLEVGIAAGLGLGFTFGVVSGGVWVQVGCSIAFTWANSGSTTTMRVFLLVRGNVDVCGLITASINLLFEISYDGERIIGAGTLNVRVKISVFYTLSVSQHVEYIFAGEKKQGGNEDYAAAYC